ncbi:MAG: hypothetical protein LBF25_00090, partial [Puniceicoccales bacterium]|nr:hypothetical protein [Puniceicoccales bacterium]
MHASTSAGVKNFVPDIGGESALIPALPGSECILNPELFDGRHVVAKDECDFQRALASAGLSHS